MKTKILVAIVAILSLYIVADFLHDTDHHQGESFHKQDVSAPQKDNVNSESDSQIANYLTLQTADKQEVKSHSHGATEHKHEGKQTDHHHDIPSDIVEAMCIDASPVCKLDLNIEPSKYLFNESGLLKTEEVGIFLGSSNYEDAITSMVDKRISTEAIEREYEYQNEITSITHDLSLANATIRCGDSACAVELENVSDDTFADFYKRFFSSRDKGNVFIAQTYADNGTDLNHRVLFFPGVTTGVIKRTD